MLLLKAKTPEDLYKKAFLEVYELPDLEGDPKNYKDTSAVLSLVNYASDEGVGFNEKGFYSSFDYDKYIQEGNKQMEIEIEHYNHEFVESNKLQSLVKCFEADPTTKKALVNLWENNHLDPQKPFPCLTYIWFRKMGNILHMNCHMRANNAYKILLMDLHIGASLHVYFSDKFGLKRGNYYHIVDTLHFYIREKQEIEALYGKLISK